MIDVSKMTACDLGRAINEGRTDPLQVLELFQDRIASDPDTANRIFARDGFVRAKGEAATSVRRAFVNNRLGLLDGIPVSWKDNFETCCMETEGGSALLEGHFSGKDAVALQRATLSGLLMLGKTHMSEFAFSGLGINPVTATAPNINGKKLVPGGSSSGAAASVAFGFAPLAVGSDTGGSVRVPAAWNNLVGFKATAAAISREGMLGLCPSFDSIGPIARSVEDCSELLAVLRGVKAPDLSGASLSGRTFVVPENVVFDDTQKAPQEAFTSAVRKLEKAGAVVRSAKLAELDTVLALAQYVFPPEAYAECGQLIEAAPEKMFSPVLERFRAGREVFAVDYLRGMQALAVAQKAFAARVARFDAVLMPTVAITPPTVEHLMSDLAYYKAANLLTLRNTRLANMLNQCAVTLPTATAACGIMAMAPAGADDRLLVLAKAMEGAL